MLIVGSLGLVFGSFMMVTGLLFRRLGELPMPDGPVTVLREADKCWSCDAKKATTPLDLCDACEKGLLPAA